jgi:chaperonin GroEL (HSP60 family)
VTRRGIATGPIARDRFTSGVDVVARAIATSAAPQPAAVLNGGPNPTSAPESLSSGRVIAQRIVGLSDPIQDAGAQMLRDLVATVTGRSGDNGAWAAAIFSGVLRRGQAAIAAGADPTRIRTRLISDIQAIDATLRQHATPPPNLHGLFASHVLDHDVREAVIEATMTTAHEGRIEIRQGIGTGIESHDIEGPYWLAKSVDPSILPSRFGQRTLLDHVAVVVTDVPLSTPRDVAALIDASHGHRSLLVVAPGVEQAALATIAMNQGQRVTVAAVNLTSADADTRRVNMDDIALLTGARSLIGAAGDALTSIDEQHIGSTRQAWIASNTLGIIAPAGDSHSIRDRIRELRSRMDMEDDAGRVRIADRIACLRSNAIALSIGGRTPADADRRCADARSAVPLAQRAIRDGVISDVDALLPIAFNDLPAVGPELEDRWSRDVLCGVLQESSCCLPPVVPASTITTTLLAAVTSAAQALTVDTFVLRNHRS